LDDKKVKVIANSISKWTHANCSDVAFRECVLKTHSPEIQSIRGRKSKGEGRSKMVDESWKDMGISRSTLYRKYR
jgi:hypothetical protein